MNDGRIESYQFILTSALSLVVEDEFIYTKIVTILPNFVFYNNTKLELYVAQSGYLDFAFTIAPGESKPFHWPHIREPKLVQICLDSLSKWDWSSSFDLGELGSIAVRCKCQSEKKNYLLVKINKYQAKELIATEIELENQEYPLYRIDNHSKTFSVQYWQKGKPEEAEYLNTLSQVPFAWSDFSHPKILVLSLYYNDQCIMEISDKVYEFSLEEVDKGKEIKVKLTKKTGRVVFISTKADGNTKILRICDVVPAYDMGKNEKEIRYNYSIYVSI